jgi:hypothetical protein
LMLEKGLGPAPKDEVLRDAPFPKATYNRC